MDAVTILADVTAVLQVGNLLVQTGAEAAPYLIQAYDIAIGKTTLTAAQRAALDAQIASLSAQLDAPSLPADQP